MTLKRKNFGDFKYFYPREDLSRAAILVAVFSSDACKEGEICPEMQIIAKLTNIPIYLLSTDENNNYSENNTCMKQGKTPFRY